MPFKVHSPEVANHSSPLEINPFLGISSKIRRSSKYLKPCLHENHKKTLKHSKDITLPMFPTIEMFAQSFFSDKMNSLLCRTVLSQNTKSCMVIKRANSFLVRSTGTLPLTNQKRTILSDSGLNRKDQLSYEEQELKNKEPFASKNVRSEKCSHRKCSTRKNVRIGI